MTEARDPYALAGAARAAAGDGDWHTAAGTLRQALELRPPFTFYARTQRLIDEVAARRPGAVRQARIAVLGSSTTGLLMPVLRALCFRDRVDAHFYEGAFGAFRQEILEPAGPLAGFTPTIAIIATHWRDLEVPAIGSDTGTRVAAVVAEYRALWSTLQQRYGCHVIQHTFDMPADDSG